MSTADGRTVPPYRTHGPLGDEGPSWAVYFRSRRSELGNGPGPGVVLEPELLDSTDGAGGADPSEQPGHDDLGAGAGDDEKSAGTAILSRHARRVSLVAEAREAFTFDEAPPPRSAVSLVKLLLENEWQVAVGLAHSFEDGGIYGDSAAKAGEKKPDFDIVSHSVHAQKPGKGKVRVVFWARAQERGGEHGSPSCVLRMASGISGDQVADKELKAWIVE